MRSDPAVGGPSQAEALEAQSFVLLTLGMNDDTRYRLIDLTVDLKYVLKTICEPISSHGLHTP